MSKSDTKSLQDKLELLTKENEQLRRKLALLSGVSGGASMTLGALTSMSGTRAPVQATIAGLSVAYLIVDKSFRVVRMNSRMAEFLNCSKTVAEQKPPLADVDTLSWAPGVCQTLLQDALESGGEETFEAERENIGGQSSFFQFKAVWAASQGTVTVEDITRLKVTRNIFERLVSPRIVQQLLDSGEDPFLTGKRRMSVLFGDLRHFTTFCEGADGPTVQAVFNEFVDACIRAIDQNDATLDKFVGDQVMILFGAPLPEAGHA
jgi:hypothetical protein